MRTRAVAALALLAVLAGLGLLAPSGAMAAQGSGLRWFYTAFASTQKLSAAGGSTTISFKIQYDDVRLARGFDVWYTAGGAETAHATAALTGADNGMEVWSATVQFPSGGLGTWTLHTGTMVDTSGHEADPLTWDYFAAVRVGYPSPPDHVDAAATGQGHVLHLTWPAASDDGGSPITGYQVYGDTQPIGSTSPDDREFDVDVAALGIGSFAVLSVNAAGVSAGSPPSPRTPAPAATPAAPRLWGATPGVRSATIGVYYPDDALTAAVTRQVVTATPGGATCEAFGGWCTLTGLEPGVEYRVTAVAENAVGTSGVSAARTVTPFLPPDAPAGVVVEEASGSSAVISWQPSAPTGTTSLVRYRAYSVPASSTCSNNWSMACTFHGLVAGTAYRFFVVATNDVGDSVPSVPVQVTGYSQPGAPDAVSMSCGVDGADVSWSAAASNGSTISGYVVLARSELGDEAERRLPPDARSLRFSDLTRGTEWRFTVAAVNAAGQGLEAWSASCVVPDPVRPPLSTVPQRPPLGPDPHRPPLKPGAPKLSGKSAHVLAVSWRRPSADGGAVIDRYEVVVTRAGHVVARLTAKPRGPVRQSMTVPRLRPHTRYSVAVRAHSTEGWSAISAAASITTPRR